MPAFPARTALADTYPNPSNATFRTGIGALWDAITGLLGVTGNKEGAIDALRVMEPGGIYNLSVVPTVGSNALTLNIKTRAGAAPSATDPVMVSQRNATAGAGDFNLRTITAALALTVSSGSTLGHGNNDSRYIYLYVIDNAGAQELAVSSNFFGVAGIVSTTAEGGAGAADSATVMYSATARSNVPFRCLGRMQAPQTTAGIWAALPTLVELQFSDTADGAITASGYTMSTARLLGRTTASTGAIEELNVLAPLSIGGGNVSVIASSDTAAGAIEVATQAEMESASSTTLAVTPGRQIYHPGTVKVWGRCGVAGDLSSPSYNVSSITDGGAGVATVNFSITLSSGNYGGWAILVESASTNRYANITGTGTTSMAMNSTIGGTGVQQDPGTGWMFGVCGDL